MMRADQATTFQENRSGDHYGAENTQANGFGPAVVMQSLHKSFGMQKVLNGIDLTVGSGKTLVALLAMLNAVEAMPPVGNQPLRTASSRFDGRPYWAAACRSNEATCVGFDHSSAP